MRDDSSRSGSIQARAFSTAFAAVLAIVSFAPPARADQLPRLRVQAFTLAADVSRPVAERPFHLIIDVRVAQRVASLDGVVLPMFGPLEILGDEKQLLVSNGGSEYRETIAVVAHQSGAIAIAPAYLDAVDARDDKPKRFLSNALTLRVGGVSAPSQLLSMLRAALELGTGIVVVLLMAWGVLRFRRPSKLAAQVAQETPPDAAPEAKPDRAGGNAYAEALADVRANPTRAGACHARERVWEHVGASPYDTLADVLRRPAAHDVAVRGVLRALERAAFTHDDDLPAAIDDAIAVLQRIESP